MTRNSFIVRQSWRICHSWIMQTSKHYGYKMLYRCKSHDRGIQCTLVHESETRICCPSTIEDKRRTTKANKTLGVVVILLFFQGPPHNIFDLCHPSFHPCSSSLLISQHCDRKLWRKGLVSRCTSMIGKQKGDCCLLRMTKASKSKRVVGLSCTYKHIGYGVFNAISYK